MNARLESLFPYPFQRLGELLAGVGSDSDKTPIAWSLGEPTHAAPDFLVALMQDETILRRGFGAYPPTKGMPELREAIADFVNQRFNLSTGLNPETQVLPANGTREALFALPQALVDPTDPGLCLLPNPFYQIYEGAALLAGSQPHYMNCEAKNGYLPDLDGIASKIWQQCRLIYICSPGNPTGAVMPKSQLKQLIELAQQYDFVIAADECYSEIYRDESSPPPGLLEAASELGVDDYKNCIAFNSLSKRSNLPGVRSGYIAGDADIIEKFLLYRTYHGSAMPLHHQILSTAAWQDEDHVIINRQRYREKFDQVCNILAPVWPQQMPEAGFFLWPETPLPDTDFTISLLRHTNVKVLPGSYLSRDATGGNPGENRVRMALVAHFDECIEAANRIVQSWQAISKA
ncbi:MAG: N-succinyldiaminopimelate aminotransferase [Candidatus Azotimanducaceae bacterium]|jgi:N-succinyldiaminopimelate aminotransferase